MSKTSASSTTPPGPGSAYNAAAVRDVFERTLAAAAEKPELRDAPKTGLDAALQKKAATAEKVATAYRLELVAGSARSLWLRAGTEEWHLDNPTDTDLGSVQAAFCYPSQELVFRHRGDGIIGLAVQSK